MAITSYSTLRTEVNNFTERAYSTDQVDTFCGLAEAEFNLILGPDYRRETAATLTTDSSGEVSLPAGFRGMRSIVRDLSGSKPLRPVSWPTLISLNSFETSGIPVNYAIQGSTLKVAPICEDDFLAVYWSALTGISNSNATNWLITAAPNAYFFGVLAVAALHEENFSAAEGYQAKAADVVSKLIGQSVVAQYGTAEMVIESVTP